jgi:hypothetical protein
MKEFKPTKLQMAAGVIFIICALAYASEDQYQRAKESEQLVAEFWQADNGHYSGEQQ